MSERLRRRPSGERVGMGFCLVPFLSLKRHLDGVATEPEVVVTAGALGEQSLARGERGFARRALRLDQSKETIKKRRHELGTRLFRRRPAMAALIDQGLICCTICS